MELPNSVALNSAFCNDVDHKLIYAQCLISFGTKNDVLVSICDSWNSKIVFAVAKVAKALMRGESNPSRGVFNSPRISSKGCSSYRWKRR